MGYGSQFKWYSCWQCHAHLILYSKHINVAPRLLEQCGNSEVADRSLARHIVVVSAESTHYLILCHRFKNNDSPSARHLSFLSAFDAVGSGWNW